MIKQASKQQPPEGNEEFVFVRCCVDRSNDHHHHQQFPITSFLSKNLHYKNEISNFVFVVAGCCLLACLLAAMKRSALDGAAACA